MSSALPTPQQVFRAWVGYILVYLAAAVPVRLLATLGASDTDPWRAQVLAGAVLLPLSYVCYRWSVRRLLAARR